MTDDSKKDQKLERETRQSVVESDDEHESIFSTPEARQLYVELNVCNAALDEQVAQMTEVERYENDKLCAAVMSEDCGSEPLQDAHVSRQWREDSCNGSEPLQDSCNGSEPLQDSCNGSEPLPDDHVSRQWREDSRCP